MRALVVVPTYNELTTLERVVRGVRAQARRAGLAVDVLVVDDASPDGTGAVAERLTAADAGVHALHRPAKGGLGPAYLAGFAWGLDRGYDVLCEMDADLSHDPADVPRLLSALGGADLVVGSRYVPGGAIVDWPPHRLALSRGGNSYVRIVTGMPVRDATSGFRAYRRSLLSELGLGTVRSDGYSFQLELVLRAWRAGFRVVEIPIVFTERREGASKISRAIVAEALWRVLQWGVRGPRRARPPHPASVAAEPSRP